MFIINKNEVLSPDRDFNDLSLTDLIRAREMFHFHLLNKKNVIATAIGRYRIRKTDPLPWEKTYTAVSNTPNRGPKTLQNSEVRQYSWPCILVIVKEWMKDEELSKYENLNEIVPKNVYMPDGKIVPICVVEAPKDGIVETIPVGTEITFPNNLISGGFPLIVESQGVQRIATITCIVTNGNKYYALTNRHVAGDEGTVIYTRLKGVLTPIGKSSGLHLGNLSFDSVYPEWSSKNLYINSDIGLIEIDDIKMWRTDVFGLEKIGQYGKLADLNSQNFTLKLIGSRVVGFGAISGKMEGEIAALFYRFKSVGGYEYASDFLIGPRTGSGQPGIETKQGDSGALWLLETEETNSDKNENTKVLMPIAVQWGQHTFIDGNGITKGAYGLATCLSNVLRALEVDLVRGWNLDNDYTWGKLGHFSIAHLACQMVKNQKLKSLLQANLEVITFGYDDLNIKNIDSGLKRMKQDYGFVPLADVPDLVWKSKITGIKRGKESPNHFADMDKKDSTGKTLLDYCKGKYDNMQFLTPEEWLSYYTDPAVMDKSKGILPFRIWQFFDAMKEYAEQGDGTGFVTAAGILSHYVGDACQPLHISYMFDGQPLPDGTKKGEHVHSIFETTMINKFIGDILPLARTRSKETDFKTILPITKGKEAAGATVEMMKKTFKLVPPKKLVDVVYKYRDQQGIGDAATAEKMWEKVGAEAMAEIFVYGAYYLACIWEGAWKAGKGSTYITELDLVNTDDVVALYENQDFIPSVNIKEIKQYLKD
ncbi:hypothetical protein [Pseudoflavitalea rhizosphaerae]|uniref:hypothetical protein n=1 Tax=Pseudoflavitalea rhizosphaerae TaxID=1884793 RepID=UPI000F8E2B5F|nr:hypothetical protein [Pseudoflavitalea rhizosphaerae]